jgi:AraC-like DNA-binding protein
LFVKKVLAQVDDHVDRGPLLRSVGLDPDGRIDPAYMIPAAEYYELLERLTDLVSDPTTFPLKVGASMRCDDYGAFGLAWKSATDLRGSYARAERYARVLTSVATYEVESTGRGAFMHLHRDGPRRPGLRLSNEATIASIAAISRQVSTREFRPLEVHFKHPTPGATEGHEEHFGCPVRFGSDRDALLVSTETLQAPNKLGDESISRFFDTHLEAEISKFQDHRTLDEQVLELVSRSLSEGVPKITDVASHLCLSARTLQRRLADGGFSYQSLVDEARRRLAARLLEETDYSLGEISFMAGFSDQSALTRAFNRWEGQRRLGVCLEFVAPGARIIALRAIQVPPGDGVC